MFVAAARNAMFRIVTKTLDKLSSFNQFWCNFNLLILKSFDKPFLESIHINNAAQN